MSDLLMGLISLALGQLIAFPLQAIVLESWKRSIALHKLRARLSVGDICAVLRDSSGGEPLLRRCVVYSIRLGRVEFRETDRNRKLVVTGREALTLHPIIEFEED